MPEHSVHRPAESAIGPIARPWLQPLGACVAWVLGMMFFYRSPISSGFDRLQGSNSDSRLLSYLTEHWYLVLRGTASWRDPSYFFPISNDLGYTDAFVLFQPFYAPLRLLGFDQFSAFQVTTMTLTTLGFVSCLVMLRHIFRVRFGTALAGAFTFAFANNLLQQSEHIQLYTVHFVPVVVLLAAAGAKAVSRGNRTRITLCGVGLGAIVALILFTSFYTGWFLIFVGIFLAFVITLLDPDIVRRGLVWARANLKPFLLLLAAVGVSFTIFGAPFFATYLPMLDISQGAPYSDVLTYMPRPGDLVNLGESNLLWGWVGSLDLYDSVSPGANERSMALTPWLVGSTLIGLGFLLRRHLSGRDRRRVRLAAAASLTVILLTMLTVRFRDFSLWKFVRYWVPGAEAARAMGRIQLLLNLVLITAWATMIDLVWTETRANRSRSPEGFGRRPAFVSLLVLVTLVIVPVEQISLHQLDELERAEQLEFLEAVPAVPPMCSAFFVVDPPQGRPGWLAQIDAMLISHRIGLPTLNGYSGIYPPSWDLMDVAAQDYRTRVDLWIAATRAPGVICSYELANHRWRAPMGPHS